VAFYSAYFGILLVRALVFAMTFAVQKKAAKYGVTFGAHKQLFLLVLKHDLTARAQDEFSRMPSQPAPTASATQPALTTRLAAKIHL
jgi:hypothetical protein